MTPSTQLKNYKYRRENVNLSLLENSALGEKLASGFIDEMRKIANLPPAAPVPATPQDLTATKTTSPPPSNRPMSTKIPAYTKNSSAVLESPSKGLQPMTQPSPIRT